MSTKSLCSLALFSTVAIGWIACSSEPGGTNAAGAQSTGAGGTSNSSSSSGETTGGNGGGAAKIPLFETDIVPIMNKSCGAGNTACHADVA